MTLFADSVILYEWTGKHFGFSAGAPRDQRDLWEQVILKTLPTAGWTIPGNKILRPLDGVPLTMVREINQALRADFERKGGQVWCSYKGKKIRVFHAKKPKQSDVLLVASTDGNWFPSEEVWIEPLRSL